MKKEKKEIEIFPVDALLQDDKEGLIGNYLIPSPSCPCCNIPNLSWRINEAYLNGFAYKEIIEMFGEEVLKRTGSKLDQSSLSDHFGTHFNDKGAAIAYYNRKKGMAGLPVAEQGKMKDIFSVIVQERVNDLELLEMSFKEQIKRMKELEDIKTERLQQGRTFGLDELIMKQSQILDALQSQILQKFKIWQKARLQNKQMEFMDKQTQWIDGKTADFLGVNLGNTVMDPNMYKEAEKLYIKVVIKNIMGKLHKSLDLVIQLDQYKKIDLFKELMKQFEGIEEEIDAEFKIKLKDVKEVKPGDKNPFDF